MSESVEIAEAVIRFRTDGFSDSIAHIEAMSFAMDDLRRFNQVQLGSIRQLEVAQRDMRVQVSALTTQLDTSAKSGVQTGDSMQSLKGELHGIGAAIREQNVRSWGDDLLHVGAKMLQVMAILRLFGKTWNEVGAIGRGGRMLAGGADNILLGGRGAGLVAAVARSKTGPFVQGVADLGAKLPDESSMFGSWGGKLGASIGGLVSPAAGVSGGTIGAAAGALLPVVGIAMAAIALLKIQLELYKKMLELTVAFWTKALTEGADRVPEWQTQIKQLGATVDEAFGNLGAPLIRALLPSLRLLTNVTEIFERFTRSNAVQGLASVFERLTTTMETLWEKVWIGGQVLLSTQPLIQKALEGWFAPAKKIDEKQKDPRSSFVGLDQFTKTLQSQLKDEKKNAEALNEQKKANQTLDKIATNTAQLQQLRGGGLATYQ